MTSAPTAAKPASVCGETGYLAPFDWAVLDDAGQLATRLRGTAGLGNVTANPHISEAWARELAASPAVVEKVTGLIGPDVAVENTFLMVKRPGDGFTVPPHQDGINDRIELDPAKAVAVWLAISPATPENGCLEVVPRSYQHGYLPYHRAAEPGSPLTTGPLEGNAGFVPVRLWPGQACALDVRLLHRSGPNNGTAPRIGLNIRYVAPGGLQVRRLPAPDLFPVAGNRW
jgi:ectoine hydroxylase-related dioxygenase (phytanoyl-CoA dioxygenase family)